MAAPLEQVTSAGKMKRVQALNGQTPLPAVTAAELIAGNPELDLQSAGRLMRDATAVYLDPRTDPPAIATDFKEVEVVYTPDGQEKERRARVFRTANVDTTAPLKIARRLPAKEGLTRFVFRAMQQLVHTDGLTFDFLFGLAKSLQDSQSMALVGAGPQGSRPARAARWRHTLSRVSVRRSGGQRRAGALPVVVVVVGSGTQTAGVV